MRTTLAIDDDVFAFVRAHAQRDHISVGEAVSRLLRQGIQAQNQAMAMRTQPTSKYALLPARAEVITSDHVRALMDQEGI